MKTEKPILFSTKMVRAIIAGDKTQTRRVVSNGDAVMRDQLSPTGYSTQHGYTIKPKYRVGDLLWVRETFAVSPNGMCLYRGHFADGTHDDIPANKIIYRADFVDSEPTTPDNMPWKPSIYMPREAARIFLRVTGVKAERIQDISEADAEAEGCKKAFRKTDGSIFSFARETFRFLWNDINEKRGYGWDVNPWVWAIKFEVERIEK